VSDSRQAAGPAALARSAAEAVRSLNHLTLGGGLEQPSDAYEVLGGLSLAASRLPQLLGQVASFLDRALAGGRLGHDLGEDPCFAVETAGLFLDGARLSAAALAGDLEQARQQLAQVNGSPSRKEEPS
jgi:hypothetical protein